MAMRITGADCWVKPNPDAIGHDCPLGNGRHRHTIGKKVHSGATLKYCSNSPIFCMESYLWICNRGSLEERNISNFLVFGPV